MSVFDEQLAYPSDGPFPELPHYGSRTEDEDPQLPPDAPTGLAVY